jgi:predicted dehydrogenase
MAFRVGIVGLGMAVAPHAKSLRDLGVDVAYAFSRSPETRKKFAEHFPFPQTDSLDTILKDSSVNAVLILTPPNTHLELVEKFAAAGKHILLEKPLETSLKKSEQLVKAASKVKLGIVLQHRFRPGAVKSQALRRYADDLGNLAVIVSPPHGGHELLVALVLDGRHFHWHVEAGP